MEPYKLEDYIKELCNNKFEYIPLFLNFYKKKYPKSIQTGRMERYLENHKDNLADCCDYIVRYCLNACNKCYSDKSSVKNHNMMWGDGDVTCDNCGNYIRMYDSG